ncbi:MAG: insulinase family protein, partial [Oscillospiraceae bacterium]|nr:insulinase family protein [Oscillospiraceae bacterium]
MYDIISTEIAQGVRFSKVRVDRFKNIRICVTALLPLERETVSSYALLSQVLTRSCEAYPDFTLLSKKLSSLYGASLEGGIRKMGESIGISFNVTGIDDRYAIKGESVAGELSELLCKIIFEPKLI